MRQQKKFAQEIEAIKAGFEGETTKARLEMQEETFQYISEEIHDNVGQYLSLAKLQLATLDFDNRENAEERVRNLSSLLSRALDDLRNLSRNLNSQLIKAGGIARAIEQQVIQLQKIGKFHVLFDLHGDYQLIPDQQEVILFRIAQEAFANIIRHASANEVIILLWCSSKEVKMRIQDNGRGFDLDLMEKTEGGLHCGLLNMQRRAKLINADFEIETKPGHGTKITITAPL